MDIILETIHSLNEVLEAKIEEVRFNVSLLRQYLRHAVETITKTEGWLWDVENTVKLLHEKVSHFPLHLQCSGMCEM